MLVLNKDSLPSVSANVDLLETDLKVILSFLNSAICVILKRFDFKRSGKV